MDEPTTPVVYRVPYDLPGRVMHELRERFGAKPGDEVVYFPGEDPPYTLQRDFDGNLARALEVILPYLCRVPPQSPSSRPSPERPDPSVPDRRGPWYLRREK